MYNCLFRKFFIWGGVCTLGASLVAQTVKHLPAMWETRVQSLVREDPLEKEMATHSSILAWKIRWMEPGRLKSMGSQESDTTEQLHFTSLCILEILSWCNWDYYERQTLRINTIVPSMPSGCRVYMAYESMESLGSMSLFSHIIITNVWLAIKLYYG